MNKRQQNLFNNLVNQIKKIKKQNVRQGSAGKDRYETSQRKFAEHLAKNYGSQNFRNVRDKHIESFIVERIENDDVTLTTLKNDLSAIRKLHDNVDAKHKISDNKAFDHILSTARVSDNNSDVDRAWTEDEYGEALSVAENMNRDDVVNAMKLAKNFGVRVEEVVHLNKQQLREALKNNYLHLEVTKNNIQRDVPVENDQQREALTDVLNNAENERIFINHKNARTYDQAEQRIQDWIYNNRDKFQDKSVQVDHREKADVTMHGLRHSYARERYSQFLENGLTERQAQIQVSHRLGHGRGEVTKLYL